VHGDVLQFDGVNEYHVPRVGVVHATTAVDTHDVPAAVVLNAYPNLQPVITQRPPSLQEKTLTE
jgi:hypothetical protein